MVYVLILLLFRYSGQCW